MEERSKHYSTLPPNHYGITTGTAATAAALAALLVLKEKVKKVEVNTSMGKLDIDIKNSYRVSDHQGRASVVKRSYKDPDVTKNMEIVADLEIIPKKGIHIQGGQGVGIVTKPGLQVPVGKSAINPYPQKMIKEHLQDLIPSGKGVKVTISVPQGEEIAQRTLNPRLGIRGGISILGTTGIARSLSSESYIKSLKCQVDVAIAQGYQHLVYVPGNIGEKFAKKLLNVDQDQIIQMGNYVGSMLKYAQEKGVEQIILLGHAGKLVKIAAGIFYTEHKVADGRREVIITHSAINGADEITLKNLYESKTTEEMINILNKNDKVVEVFNSISQEIRRLCMENYALNVDVLILRMDGTILNNDHVQETLDTKY